MATPEETIAQQRKVIAQAQAIAQAIAKRQEISKAQLLRRGISEREKQRAEQIKREKFSKAQLAEIAKVEEPFEKKATKYEREKKAYDTAVAEAKAEKAAYERAKRMFERGGIPWQYTTGKVKKYLRKMIERRRAYGAPTPTQAEEPRYKSYTIGTLDPSTGKYTTKVYTKPIPKYEQEWAKVVEGVKVYPYETYKPTLGGFEAIAPGDFKPIKDAPISKFEAMTIKMKPFQEIPDQYRGTGGMLLKPSEVEGAKPGEDAYYYVPKTEQDKTFFQKRKEEWQITQDIISEKIPTIQEIAEPISDWIVERTDWTPEKIEKWEKAEKILRYPGEIGEGIYSEIQEKPLKAVATTAIFFVVPGALGLAGKGAQAVGITGALSKVPIVAKIAKPVFRWGLPALYGTSVGIRISKADKPFETTGRIIGGEIIPMGAGGYLGAKYIPKISGWFRTRGRTEIPTEKIISEKVLVGRETFPTAPQQKHYEIFMKQKQALPITKLKAYTGKGELIYPETFKELPFEVPKGGYHATAPQFWKKGKGFEVTKGASEFEGLYIAPEVSPHFLRAGQKYTLIGGDLFTPYGEGAVARVIPTRFVRGKKGKVGEAYIPSVKGEVEAIIPPKTQVEYLSGEYYFKYKDVRTPIDVFKTTPSKKPSFKTKTYKDVVYSYELPKRYGITTPSHYLAGTISSYLIKKPSRISYTPSVEEYKPYYTPSKPTSYTPSYKPSRVTSYKPSRVSFKPSRAPSYLPSYTQYKPYSSYFPKTSYASSYLRRTPTPYVLSYKPTKPYSSYFPSFPSVKSKISSKSKQKIPVERQGWTFEIRRKQKWERAKLPFAFATKEGAEARAQKRVLSEAAASYRVVEAKEGKRIVKSLIMPSLYRKVLFRKAKKEKGVMVQKKKLRILSKGEKREISYAGGLARMKKSKPLLYDYPILRRVLKKSFKKQRRSKVDKLIEEGVKKARPLFWG